MAALSTFAICLLASCLSPKNEAMRGARSAFRAALELKGFANSVARSAPSSLPLDRNTADSLPLPTPSVSLPIAAAAAVE